VDELVAVEPLVLLDVAGLVVATVPFWEDAVLSADSPHAQAQNSALKSRGRPQVPGRRSIPVYVPEQEAHGSAFGRARCGVGQHPGVDGPGPTARLAPR
jgi:hypothetical protein